MKKGFTLIELLIVVAIIAILAAIAVPNFLEAQVRAKVSRVKADMRTIATALESYSVDNNNYPWDGSEITDPDPPSAPGIYMGTNIPSRYGTMHLNPMLTTPIAYLSNVDFKDPFNAEKSGSFGIRYLNLHGGFYKSLSQFRRSRYDQYYQVYGFWVLSSFGPNKTTDTQNATDNPLVENIPGANVSSLMTRYDPTNGTVSKGDVMRCQKTGDNPIYPPKFPIQ